MQKITIIAHPSTKKPRVEKDMLGALHIYVREPALEGRANGAMRKALADYMQVKENQLMLISGAKKKQKTYAILQN